MKELLNHLRAHLSTRDPWVLVYDNQGTIPAGIGDCITLNSYDSDLGMLFGFPVVREITVNNALSCNPVFVVRMSRQYLRPMIDRLEKMVA